MPTFIENALKGSLCRQLTRFWNAAIVILHFLKVIQKRTAMVSKVKLISYQIYQYAMYSLLYEIS